MQFFRLFPSFRAIFRPVQHHDTLVWKINALRFVPEDYVLTAESRTVHGWAFAVMFLLLALSVYCWKTTNCKKLIDSKYSFH